MLQHKTTRTLLYSLLGSLLLPALLAADEPKVDPDPDVRVERKVIKTGACPEIVLGNGQKVHFLGASSRGFLGVELTNLSPELRDHFGVPGEGGVMVSRVVEGSAAEAAGIIVGDIITRVNNAETSSAGELGRAVRGQEGGAAVTVEVFRDGSLRQLTATLAEHERCALDVSQFLSGMEVDLGDLDLEALELEGLEGLEELKGLEALEGLKVLDLESLGELGELGGEISAEVMRGLAEAFEGQEWEEALERFESIDMERFEERMEQMQERMEQLEERLERERERIERDVERKQREREREREREEPSEEPQEPAVPAAPQKL